MILNPPINIFLIFTVSHIYIFTILFDFKVHIVLLANSTPTVGSCSDLKRQSLNYNIRQDFPTSFLFVIIIGTRFSNDYIFKNKMIVIHFSKFKRKINYINK